MKKQILLTNYYTMTTIKVTSESFYSITEDCLKSIIINNNIESNFLSTV